MYILFNADGSVLKTNFTEIINQNNNEVNEIFVAFANVIEDGQTVSGIFVLPNGQKSIEIGTFEANYEYADDLFANGYLIPITQAETLYEGTVLLTIQVVDNNSDKVLYTYRTKLTINPTAIDDDVTSISIAQYNRLVDLITQNADNIEKIVLSNTTKLNSIYSFSGQNVFIASNGQKKYIGSLTKVDESNYSGRLVSVSRNSPQYIEFDAISGGTEWSTIESDYTKTFAFADDLSGKQDVIDSSHKLDADLVDDSTSTNKFVTATDITNWDAKLDKKTFAKTDTIMGKLYGGNNFLFSVTGISSVSGELLIGRCDTSGVFHVEIESLSTGKRWYAEGASSSITFEQLLTDTYRQDYLKVNSYVPATTLETIHNAHLGTVAFFTIGQGGIGGDTSSIYIAQIKQSLSDSSKYSVEIESLNSDKRWYSNAVAIDTTLLTFMVDDNRQDYALKSDIVPIIEFQDTDTLSAIYTATNGKPFILLRGTGSYWLARLNEIIGGIYFELESFSSQQRYYGGVSSEDAATTTLATAMSSTYSQPYVTKNEFDDRIPEAPNTNGNYRLHCTVTNGGASKVYAWIPV